MTGGGSSDREGPSIRVRVTDLRRVAGSQMDLQRELDLGGLGVGSVEISGETAVLRAVLESVSGGVRVRGTVALGWSGECRRCLGAASGQEVAGLSELYEDHPSSEDSGRIEDGWIELGPAVRDAALLSLPLAPLCSARCEGPAPADFPVRPESEGGAVEGSDPRWAGLSELRFDPEG